MTYTLYTHNQEVTNTDCVYLLNHISKKKKSMYLKQKMNKTMSFQYSIHQARCQVICEQWGDDK